MPPFVRVKSLWADLAGLAVWQRGDCLCCKEAGSPCSASSLSLLSFYCSISPSTGTVARKVDLPLDVVPSIIAAIAERCRQRNALGPEDEAIRKPSLDELMGDQHRLCVDPDGPSSSLGKLVWPVSDVFDHMGSPLPLVTRALWPDHLLSALVFNGEPIGASVWAHCINSFVDTLHDVVEEVWMERTAREWGYYISPYESILTVRAGVDPETVCSESARADMSKMAKKQSELMARLHNELRIFLKPLGITSRLGELDLKDPYYASRVGES